MPKPDPATTTIGRPKVCSACGAPFVCNTDAAAGGCWCNELPVLLAIDPAADCMCPTCLRAAVEAQARA